MKHVRSAALSRHSAPAFVLLAGLELMTLRRLTWLARCLFMELVAMADFADGKGRTSYAVLGALLAFDSAPQAHEVPTATTKRLRTAMAELQAAGLVRLDRIKNEKAKALFFRVTPRVGISAANDMRGRVRGRPETPKKPATARPAARRRADEGQSEGQGVQEPIPSPLPPSLSTDTPPPKAAREALKAATERLRAGVGKRAPKGA